MTSPLAELALWIALPISIWGSVLAFLGGNWRRGDLVLSAERSVHVVFGLLLVASAGLAFALIADRFDHAYVFAHSSRGLNPAFKLTAFWAGPEGSLLLWGLGVGFVSALAVWLNRRRNRELMPYVAGVLLVVLTFLVVLILFASPPFERLDFIPHDGRGLDPRLQSHWMAIHPPVLHLGLAAFTVPFAFAVAALLSGRLGPGWIRATRQWVLVAWFLLTLGIILGMRWAYEDPGPGGYGSWDPVRNTSLLPWLVATAVLHSIPVQESRGILRASNLGLLCLAFLTTIPALLLTRPGLLDSGHAFGHDPVVAGILAGFMAVTGSVCLVLILWRLPQLRSLRLVDPVVSRQAGAPRRDRRWEGSVVHAGAVVVFVGFAGSLLATEVRQSLLPGESMSIRSAFGHEYTLTYRGLSTHQGRNMWHVIALLGVSRDGAPVGPMTTELRFTHSPPQPTTGAGIRSTLLEDLHVTLAEVDPGMRPGVQPESEQALFQVRVNPLGPWIWYGGLVIVVGVLIGLRPGRGAPGGRQPGGGEAGDRPLRAPAGVGA